MTLSPNSVSPANEQVDSATPPPRNPHRLRSRAVYVVAAAVAAFTVLAHVLSYSWSVSLTLCDVTVTDDEGLLALNVPLVRLAATESPTSGFMLYRRGPKFWVGSDGGNGGKTFLRYWMARLDEFRCKGGMIAGFGYWKGGWQSDARPGPFVVLIMPIWFAGLAVFATFFAVRLGLVRFRLRTMLLAFTLFAGLLWLLTLRAAE